MNNGNERKDGIQSNIKKALISAKFLLITGIIISSGFIVEGLLCFTMCSVNVRSYILSFYYVVFGLLSICAELKFELIHSYLFILFSYSGRGFWYIFLGSIALGGEWWAILIALFLIMLGCLNLFAGCQRGGNIPTDDDNGKGHNRLESEPTEIVSEQLGISNSDVNVA
eukprot:948293_1